MAPTIRIVLAQGDGGDGVEAGDAPPELHAATPRDRTRRAASARKVRATWRTSEPPSCVIRAPSLPVALR